MAWSTYQVSGLGEKLDALELFHPDRLASRILGMGDVLSLIEQAEKKVDKAKAEKFAQKLKKVTVLIWKISRINLIRWLIWVE